MRHALGDAPFLPFICPTRGERYGAHSFGTRGDGIYPRAALTDVDGTLYGTTLAGGAYNYGTVFAFTP